MKRTLLVIAMLLLSTSVYAAENVTFSLSHSVDDTVGVTGVLDLNLYTEASNAFGRIEAGELDLKDLGFIRWEFTLPPRSRATTSDIAWVGSTPESGSFTAQIHLMDQSGSPGWKTTGVTGGWHTNQYAQGSDLSAESLDSVSSVAWTPAAWVLDGDYTSPEIKTLVQAALDSWFYSPLDANDAYVGLYFSDGNGTYNPTTRRVGYAYDSDPAKAPEWDITFIPGGELGHFVWDEVRDRRVYRFR